MFSFQRRCSTTQLPISTMGCDAQTTTSARSSAAQLLFLLTATSSIFQRTRMTLPTDNDTGNDILGLACGSVHKVSAIIVVVWSTATLLSH